MKHDFDGFQREYGDWEVATFPNASPESRVNHLREEVEELAAAITAEECREECADILGILLAYAESKGFSLFAAARIKLAINRGRTWQKTADANGVHHHVREGEAGG